MNSRNIRISSKCLNNHRFLTNEKIFIEKPENDNL